MSSFNDAGMGEDGTIGDFQRQDNIFSLADSRFHYSSADPNARANNHFASEGVDVNAIDRSTQSIQPGMRFEREPTGAAMIDVVDFGRLGQDSPRKRRKGRRLYTGCITCRERKIKCDETRPTCKNCARSRNYVCEGYDNVDDALSRYRRSSSYCQPFVNPMHRQPTEFNRPQPINIGMNGPQPVHQPEPARRPADDMNLNPLGPDFSDDMLQMTSLSFPSTPFHDGLAHIDLLDLGGDATDRPRFDDNMDRFEELRSVSDDDSRREETAADNHRPFVQETQSADHEDTSPSDVSSPEMQYLSPEALSLIDHYRRHVCTLMMPAAFPSQNPWLTIYLPIALSAPTSRAKQALLNAILAVSAFNKAELFIVSREELRSQGRTHSEEAHQALKDIIHASKDCGPVDRQAMLAAALTLTTVEVFSGANDGKGYEYLWLARDVIQLTGGTQWWLSSSANLTLLQIFRCLRIIAYTSGWTSQADPSQKQDSQQEANAGALAVSGSRSLQYTLDVTFGVAMKTLDCLNKVIELSTIRTARLAARQPWTAEDAKDVQKLEDDLFSVFHDPLALTNNPLAADAQAPAGLSHIVMDEIKENHVWAFHYSVALFYRRALCNGSTSIQPSLPPDLQPQGQQSERPTGQYLVSQALEHLENVDALSSNVAIANTLWPAFIAAVEAVEMPLRHRALIWFKRAKRHGIGNIAKAKALVMEVWRQVDRQSHFNHEQGALQSELGQVDWREVMREKGMYVMLT